MSDPFLGEIRFFGFNFAPKGWQLCNGQLLPINQNQALFALLGTFYGGNGTSTFALPDLRGRAPVHQGQGTGLSAYTIGEPVGTESVSVLQSNMPAHTHTITVSPYAPQASLEPADTDQPSGAVLAASNIYGPATSTVSMATQAITAVASAAGSSIPISIVQPILVGNFCIAMQGIFPSRN